MPSSFPALFSSMGMSLKQRAKSKSSFQKTFASTASLEGLPYEILSIILELLIPERGPICEESRRYLRYNEPLGLLALNRCNRSLNALTTPLLYHTFTHASHQSWIHPIQTILSRRDLAALVQHISLADGDRLRNTDLSSLSYEFKLLPLLYYYFSARQRNAELQLSGSEERVPTDPKMNRGITVSDFIRHAEEKSLASRKIFPELSSAESWRMKLRWSLYKTRKTIYGTALIPLLPVSQEVKHLVVGYLLDGYTLAIFAFMLYTLPNLSSVSLNITYNRDADHNLYIQQGPDPLQVLLANILSPSSILLPNLHTFTLNYLDRTHQSNLKFVFPLLLQPTLTTFHCTNLCLKNWIPPEDHISASLALSHLTLQSSNLSTPSLKAFLGLCPHLTHLTYKHEQYFLGSEERFHAAAFTASISHLRCSLTHLTVHQLPKPDRTTPPPDRDICLLNGKVLKGFERLKRLDVDANLLLGPQDMDDPFWLEEGREVRTQELENCVPSSLEGLVLRGCSEGVEGQVRRFLETAGKAKGKLREVDVVFSKEMRGRGCLIFDDVEDDVKLRTEIIMGVKVKFSY